MPDFTNALIAECASGVQVEVIKTVGGGGGGVYIWNGMFKNTYSISVMTRCPQTFGHIIYITGVLGSWTDDIATGKSYYKENESQVSCGNHDQII